MIKSWKTKVGDWIIVLICCVLMFVCLVPLLNVLARSLSSTYYLNRNEVLLWPRGLSLDAYTNVLKDAKYTYSLGYTAILTVVCTIISLTITVLCAFPLIFDQLKGRKFMRFRSRSSWMMLSRVGLLMWVPPFHSVESSSTSN